MRRLALNVATLSQLVLDDVFIEFNGSRRWLRNLLEPLARPAAQRFAGVAVRFDETVAHFGFREGMRELISNFASEIKVSGCEHVPEEGPLLLISNHPGTYDSLAITASLPRDDLKAIAFGFALLRRLPNASRHLIFTDPGRKPEENFSVLRAAIRHLQSGGAVLIFPSGKIEPDPAVLPGAAEALSAWSPGFDLLMRKVPQTKVQLTIASGVLAPVLLRNPLIKLWKRLGNPQNVAEIIQIITQMLLGRRIQVRPNISFGLPKTVDELWRGGSESLYNSVIAEAGHLLTDHMREFIEPNPFPGAVAASCDERVRA